jgi:hypothetical protein
MGVRRKPDGMAGSGDQPGGFEVGKSAHRFVYTAVSRISIHRQAAENGLPTSTLARLRLNALGVTQFTAATAYRERGQFFLTAAMA